MQRSLKNHKNKFLRFSQWLIVTTILLGTIFVWKKSRLISESELNREFDREVEYVKKEITQNFEEKEHLLNSTAAFIQSSKNELNLNDWEDYANLLNLYERYPGIQGIGVVYRVFDFEEKIFIERQRQFRSDFNIFNKSKNGEYWPVTFILPQGSNFKAIGFDVSSEEMRLKTGKKAIELKKAQLTGQIFLVQDAEKTPGFIMMYPFYNKDIAKGFIVAPMIIKNLLQSIFVARNKDIFIKIKDENRVLYDEIQQVHQDPNFFPQRKIEFDLQLYGRLWNIIIETGPKFHTQFIDYSTYLILGCGLMFAFIVYGAIEFLLRKNQTMELETQKLNLELLKKNDALEKANLAKNEFIANMSHELRTPLNTILGFSQIISQEIEEQPVKIEMIKKFSLKINSAGKHLLKLISEILDIAKIESGKVQFNYSTIEVKDFFDSIEEPSLVLAKIKNNKFELKLDLQQPIIETDETRLRQVLMNLISNAAKFTENGTISVSVSNAIDHLCIVVQDTGRGMNEEQLKLIFEKFVQVHDTRKDALAGTGLGLAITKKIVEGMNGQISVKSELNKGTSFEIIFKSLKKAA